MISRMIQCIFPTVLYISCINRKSVHCIPNPSKNTKTIQNYDKPIFITFQGIYGKSFLPKSFSYARVIENLTVPLMKKSLLMLAIGLASTIPASATALFTDPAGTYTYDNVTCTAGTLTGDHGALYSRQSIYNVSHFRKSNAATTAVAVTIDLTAASKVTEPTKLLTIDSKHELGLMATPEGITGNWHGKTWGETVSYARLASHPAAFVRDGITYISFTTVFSGCAGAGWNGIGGTMGYDINGDLIIKLPLLASAENKDFNSVSANLDFVKVVSLNPVVSRNVTEVAASAAQQAAKIERKFLKTRGELLSPTQWVCAGIAVLVAMGFASITLFRKGKWC